MLRRAMRPLAMLARPRGAITTPASQVWHLAPAASSRAFAAAAVKKPKVEDGTLEGRYATALFMASADRLDKVYGDLSSLRNMMQESKEFKLMVETPGIDPESKVAVFESICTKASIDASVLNFLKVLIENKRMHLLNRMIDLFEGFYRAEKGLVVCKVTSAQPLSASQQKQVKQAMQKRAAKGSTLLMEYSVNPSLLGGLVVKMGEAVLDQSVSTRLERLTTQLLAPVV
mmetsp:Transcript_72127/g.211330  ORF Transcript_72127/g.211330 Transcript_72127/m.211330 type:complete len:230 (+) Transcript_72127:43-732(+)